MSSVRRPLLTATAAGALLCGLWFVPTANATGENDTPRESRDSSSTTSTSARTAPITANRSADRGAPGAADGAPDVTGQRANAAGPAAELRLADTGGFDTTPYVVGGTAFLTAGAGFVALSARQHRRVY